MRPICDDVGEGSKGTCETQSLNTKTNDAPQKRKRKEKKKKVK